MQHTSTTSYALVLGFQTSYDYVLVTCRWLYEVKIQASRIVLNELTKVWLVKRKESLTHNNLFSLSCMCPAKLKEILFISLGINMIGLIEISYFLPSDKGEGYYNL